MTKNPDASHRKVAVLTPVEAGDLAAVNEWIALRCRGRTVAELSTQLEVEPSMDAVVRRLIRSIKEPDRAAAAKLCELELNRVTGGLSRRAGEEDR